MGPSGPFQGLTVMKIVIDDKIPFIRGVFEPYAQVVYLPGASTTADDVRDADALITRTRTKCNASLLEGSSVKIVFTATIGFDHIDTQWCESNGIIWRSAPGCNSGSVRQYIAAALVTLCDRYGLNFKDVTLGVVGVGNVGSKVASAAGAMGMKVLLNDPPRERREGSDGFSSLDDIIGTCNIITLHVPMQKTGPDATYHLFDGTTFDRMGRGAILINSSRGPVVSNSDLKEALATGKIRAAALDVWENEPAPDSELVSLLDITTPHIAGYSADGKANGTSAAVRGVAEVLGIESLKGWSVPSVPGPEVNTEFSVNAAGLSFQQTIAKAILHTYDIGKDSDALCNSLESFEKLRGSYPIRREFEAFTVRLENGTEEERTALGKIGFRVI